jgi:hypothetical protein
MIQIVDNFIGLSKDNPKTISKLKKESIKGYECEIASNSSIKEDFFITLRDYQDKKYLNNTFFSFFKDEEKRKLFGANAKTNSTPFHTENLMLRWTNLLNDLLV